MKFAVAGIWTMIICHLMPSFSVIAEESEPYFRWKNWRQKPDLQIQYRDREDSLIEIHASFSATSTLSGFLFFIQDLDNVQSWVAQSKKAEYLEIFSSNEFVFKTQFSPVWPISERHLIVRSSHQQLSDGTIKINLEDVSELYPSGNEDVVTAKLIAGSWSIKATGSDKLEGDYKLVIDPMGDVPLWLAKQASLSNMWDTLVNLQSQLPTSKWQAFQAPFIKEWQAIQVTPQ